MSINLPILVLLEFAKELETVNRYAIMITIPHIPADLNFRVYKEASE